MDELGRAAEVLARAPSVALACHVNPDPDALGSMLVLDAAASSTAELVVRLVERMGGELTDEAAALLYAGIVTDTGRFQYEATTPETLRVAALLRARSFDHARLAQALFEQSSVGYLRLLGVALGRIQLDPAANLVWTYLTQTDLSSSG